MPNLEILRTEPIDRFDGDYAMFSNFYPAIVHYKQIAFPTVEHAFVAAKSYDPAFWEEISKLPAKRAGHAKRRGRQIKLRSNWDLLKRSVMKELLLEKFNNRVFREFIVRTTPAMLIEGNYWHDNYWGNCKCKKCKYILGQNHLGRLLMEVRGSL